MKCPLCGHQFKEEDGRAACTGCPLARVCQKVQCPNCGYEVPAKPKLIEVFKSWRRRDNGVRRKG